PTPPSPSLAASPIPSPASRPPTCRLLRSRRSPALFSRPLRPALYLRRATDSVAICNSAAIPPPVAETEISRVFRRFPPSLILPQPYTGQNLPSRGAHQAARAGGDRRERIGRVRQ